MEEEETIRQATKNQMMVLCRRESAWQEEKGRIVGVNGRLMKENVRLAGGKGRIVGVNGRLIKENVRLAGEKR